MSQSLGGLQKWRQLLAWEESLISMSGKHLTGNNGTALKPLMSNMHYKYAGCRIFKPILTVHENLCSILIQFPTLSNYVLHSIFHLPWNSYFYFFTVQDNWHLSKKSEMTFIIQIQSPTHPPIHVLPPISIKWSNNFHQFVRTFVYYSISLSVNLSVSLCSKLFVGGLYLEYRGSSIPFIRNL